MRSIYRHSTLLVLAWLAAIAAPASAASAAPDAAATGTAWMGRARPAPVSATPTMGAATASPTDTAASPTSTAAAPTSTAAAPKSTGTAAPTSTAVAPKSTGTAAPTSTAAAPKSTGTAAPTSTSAGPDLAAEAKAIAEAGLKRYGDGYISRIDAARHIVYLSAANEQMLARVMDVLGPYADRQRQFLFPKALMWNITVVLPTLDDYRKNLPAGMDKAMGYYQMSTRTLQAISLSDILLHEFTHGMHHADQVQARQRHPAWISEGLATLFQGSRWRQNSLEPALDPSLATLQQALRDNKAHPLAKLVTMTGPAFVADDKLCYAEARYIMFYLYRLGRLKEFYETYKAGYARDRTGAAALAATLGTPLEQVEADWQAWVLAQTPPWTPANPPKTFLGLRTEEAGEGLKVAGLVRGSMAEQGGLLKVGDIILSLDGRGISAMADLSAAVQACKPGEIVEIELIRDGRMMTVRQVLGATRP